MKLLRPLCFVALVLFIDASVQACGPLWGNDYVVHGGNSPLIMPRATFYHELRRVLEIAQPPPSENVSSYGRNQEPETAIGWDATLRADLEDLGQALGTEKADRDQILADYKQMRTDLRKRAAENGEKNSARDFGEPPVSGTDYGPLGDFLPKDAPREKSAGSFTPFDVAPYEPLIAKLPEEFARYVRGAAAFYNEDFDKAIELFRSVLNLPAEQRHYHSTWAAYMLGKTWLHKDAEQALPFFEQTRQLAQAGFADSLRLADESVGWEARANATLNRIVPAIHGYAKMAKEQPSPAADLALISIRWVCGDVFGYKNGEAIQAGGPSWAQDELCRRIFTVWFLTAGSYCSWSVNGKSVNGIQWWLETVEKATPPGAVIADADFLAWAAYQSGQLDTAARWLKMADPDRLMTQWLQAKFLIRDGKLDEAEQLLRKAQDHPDAKDVWDAIELTEDLPEPVAPAERIECELGMFKLAKGDYVEAMETFAQSGQQYEYDDAAYVAELVLTVDELEAYVKTKPERNPFWGICVGRLAREGFWDRAAALYPESNANYGGENSRDLALKVADCLRDGRDTQQPARHRAERLFEAAELVYSNVELVRAELEPDWYGGTGFKQKIERLSRQEGPLAPSADELARVERNGAPPYDRFSYKLTAAGLMWECAQLLPDNDVLCARALFTGGTYIKARRPKEADKFYKALVARNPNLAIAQEADKLRWFPREFTDKVLYHPAPPQPVSKRKIAKIIAICIAGAAVPAGLAVLCLRRRRRTTVSA